ncbi:MAG: methylenetetrahydrofolate reductase [Acidimicrobiales bacterium]|jgi:methylenetetrahydrofolate reductase (NADPH)|nr:methylenetetrahydrofolate reductase [Acidimicrobiales bacterium]
MTTIRDLLDRGRTLSFEFFPPKTHEAQAKLRATVDLLEKADPDFVSVTYGAGGTTRESTRETVLDLLEHRSFPAMPHLTCVGHSYAEIQDLIDDYQAHGVHNMLALAGDPPEDGSPNPGDFRYALELVEALREHSDMSIGVAAFPEVHPRSESRASDRSRLAEKLNAADFGITQFFFDPSDYFCMIDELDSLGCNTPVIPGVIPVINPKSVRRFAGMNGSAVDEALWARLDAADDPDERLEVAVDAAVSQIQTLLDGGAPGVHIYTLNQVDATVRISERIDIR